MSTRARKGLPIVPSESTWDTYLIGTCQRQFSWTSRGTPAAWHSATMASAPAAEGAIGFWQITAIPSAAARQVSSGHDVDEVKTFTGQQSLWVVVNGGDAELPGQGLGFRASPVVHRHTLGPLELTPGPQLEPGPEPSAKDGEPQRVAHGCQPSRSPGARRPCLWYAI